MKVKGIVHIHSKFSDGMLSLEEIKQKAQKLGVSFVLIADHFEKIEDFSAIERECSRLSDDKFLVVPGAEMLSRENYHFLICNLHHIPLSMYGKELSFKEIYSTLKSKETLFILAHASLYPRLPGPEILAKLDGIEVWNSKYNSRYAPCVKSLRFALAHNLVAFAGVDAHGPFSLKKIHLELDLPKLDIKEVIQTLKKGEFKVVNGSFALDLRTRLNKHQAKTFRVINRGYKIMISPFAWLIKSKISCPKPLIKFFQGAYSQLKPEN